MNKDTSDMKFGRDFFVKPCIYYCRFNSVSDVSLTYLLQQLYFFENAVGCGQAQKHDAQHDKIPVFVLKFRHIGEVHSVDAGDDGQRRCKYGKQRQFVDEFIRL